MAAWLGCFAHMLHLWIKVGLEEPSNNSTARQRSGNPSQTIANRGRFEDLPIYCMGWNMMEFNIQHVPAIS